MNPEVQALLDLFESKENTGSRRKARKSYRSALNKSGATIGGLKPNYAVPREIVQDLLDGLSNEDLIEKHGRANVNALNDVLGMGRRTPDKLGPLLRDAANKRTTRTSLINKHGKDAVETLEKNLGIKADEKGFKAAAKERKNVTKASDYSVRKATDRTRNYAESKKGTAAESRDAQRKLRRKAATKTVANRPGIPGMFDKSMKLGKLAKFGRFAGPAALGALGVYEVYNLTQQMKGERSNAVDMASIEELFANQRDMSAARNRRDDVEGLSTLASISDLTPSNLARQAGHSLKPETAHLLSGYEDIIQANRGKTRPTLEQAYARMGVM